MSLFDPNCEACKKRREAIAAWMEACRQWALNPIGRPMPTPPTDGLAKITDEKKIDLAK